MYATVEQVTSVFLCLVTDGNLAGFGCAGPDAEVTGETPQAVIEALSAVARPLLQGADPLRRSVLLEKLQPILASQPSALATHSW